MKSRKWMLPAVTLALASLAGCAQDQVFVTAADQFVNVTVGPEYEAYVNADADLLPEQKVDRLQNVASFREVIRVKKGGQ